MIELKDVSKSYGDIKAARSLSFKLNKGEVMGFLGPNGAGKTTAMKMITGYMPPEKGVIEVMGKDAFKSTVETRKHIGYLPETNPLYTDMTVEEYLTFIAQMREIKDVEKSMKSAIEKCGIDKVRHRIIGHLSKGYRQRVGLAQAIIHDPEILILDEPVNGLDPKQITEIRSLIKKLGEEKTVILCSHILSEVEAVADRVLIINEGEIVADDTIEDLRERSRGNAVFILEVLKGSDDIVKFIEESGKVQKVEVVNPTTYKLFAHGEQEMGNEIFKMAVDNGWPVSQLYMESNSLEDMFLNLTKGGDQ
jgi:ABC-2 type transport system ATP-binding protein